MAHIQKYKAPQVNGILEHNSRTDATRQHNHSNEDIDPTKTHLNYELHSTKGTALERYKARMSELHCMQRDDVTVFDSLVVTLPKNVKKGDEKAFFKSCYDFACKDFGKENIVNATVHNDETTPHIHIGFIPTVKAKNRKGEDVVKVRHSALITKKYLCTMHEKLSEHISQDIGYEVSILNGATAGGNKRIQELKAEKATEKAKKAEEKARQAEQNAAMLQEQVRKLTEEKEQLYEEKEQAHEALLKITEAPPRPPEPHEPSNYESWCYYHKSEDYKVKSIKPLANSAKNIEERRKADYEEKEIAPFKAKKQACADWDKEWGVVEVAKKVIEREETLIVKEQALRRKETAQNERERNLDKEVEKKVTKRIEGIFDGLTTDREYRLRDYCDTVKFEDGTSVLDRFEEQEQALRESIEVKRVKGQGFSR